MKTCIADNCNYPVWSKRFCKNHQHLRPDFKKPLLKTRQYKQSVKSLDIIVDFKNQTELFEWIWTGPPPAKRICFITGKKITVPKPINFAHVLPKGRFPEFTLCAWNIRLVLAEIHPLLDHGHKEQRDNYEKAHGCSFKKWFDLYEDLYSHHVLKTSQDSL